MVLLGGAEGEEALGVTVDELEGDIGGLFEAKGDDGDEEEAGSFFGGDIVPRDEEGGVAGAVEDEDGEVEVGGVGAGGEDAAVAGPAHVTTLKRPCLAGEGLVGLVVGGELAPAAEDGDDVDDGAPHGGKDDEEGGND